MTEKQETAAEWLGRVYTLNCNIAALKQEKLSLQLDYKGIGTNIGAGHKDSSLNSVELRRTQLADLGRQIDREIAALGKEVALVKRIIKAIPAQHYALLSYRYISMLSWELIEDKLHISTSTRKRYHLAALDAVYIKLKKDGLV